jgi:hypothetical protein
LLFLACTGAKQILRKPAYVADGCFDGLYWETPRALVGVQNCVHETGRIMRLRLNADFSAIESAEVLESYNPLFNGITTAAIAGNQLYFVANVQLAKLDREGRPQGQFDPLSVLRLALAGRGQKRN